MRKQTLVDAYMNEIIDYGGEDYTRAEVIRDMQRMGYGPRDIDLWFIGYEVGQEMAEKRRARQAIAEARTQLLPAPRLRPSCAKEQL